MNVEEVQPANQAPPARRPGVVVYRAIVAFTLFLLVLLWGGLALHLTELRTKELDHVDLNAVSLSRTVAEYATRVLRAIDQSLLRLKVEYEQDPASFDLAAAVADDPYLKDVAIRVIHIREDGMATAVNGPTTRTAFLGNSTTFLSLKESRADEMTIGRPVPGPISGRADIRLSRRLNHSSGAFAGVVAVLLDPRYFSDFFRNLDVGKTGFITLVGLDGIIRARFAMGKDDGVGQDMSSAPLFQQIKKGAEGFYESDSPIDRVPRHVGFRLLGDYPLIATVGYGLDEVLTDYYGHRRMLAAIAAALSLVFVGVAFLLARQVTLQIRTELLLRERERELTRSRNEAEHASRTKSEFLANMSHELRTPLNAIIGFSEMMIQGVMGPIGSPKYLDYAKDIHRSGTHLLDLISGILDMSKIESGHYRLSLEKVDIAELGDVCLRILAGRAEQGRVELVNRMAPDLPRLDADPRAIRQILLNLLSNAVKFTPPGGRVVLAAERAPDGMVVVSVSDTGIGIAARDLGRIGKPFQQVEDDALNRKHEGAGLGLAITKQLVEMHGGELAIASTIGTGTTVTIRLPAPVTARAASSAS